MTRQAGLIAALLATLAASAGVAWLDAGDETALPAPGARPASNRPGVVPAAGEAARARGPVRAADDRPAWPSSPWRASADWPRLSGRDGWDPPAPPAPPAPPRQPARAEAAPASAPPAAAPATPPLPYRWIGRIDDALGAQALLAGPTRTVAVRVSDVLEGQWRVDAVHEATVTLSWLPTGEQQVLSFRPI